MKFKIKEVKEIKNRIHIKFETEFGEDKFRTKIEDNYLDKLTGKPIWFLKLSNYIRKKYDDTLKLNKSTRKYKDYIDINHDLEQIEDTRPTNILNIQQQSIKETEEGIVIQNKKIKVLADEHHDLVDERRKLESQIIKEKTKIADCEECIIKNNGKKL